MARLEPADARTCYVVTYGHPRSRVARTARSRRPPWKAARPPSSSVPRSSPTIELLPLATALGHGCAAMPACCSSSTTGWRWRSAAARRVPTWARTSDPSDGAAPPRAGADAGGQRERRGGGDGGGGGRAPTTSGSPCGRRRPSRRRWRSGLEGLRAVAGRDAAPGRRDRRDQRRRTLATSSRPGRPAIAVISAVATVRRPDAGGSRRSRASVDDFFERVHDDGESPPPSGPGRRPRSCSSR